MNEKNGGFCLGGWADGKWRDLAYNSGVLEEMRGMGEKFFLFILRLDFGGLLT
jgi:hypothetical protein